MDSLRTQALARKLALDFIAFKLELERRSCSCDIVSLVADKTCAMYRAILNHRYKVARELGDQIMEVIDCYKTKSESHALTFNKLRNHAGEVVRILNKK